MIYPHSLDYTITSEHTEILVQTARFETRVPGGAASIPANNTRDCHGNLHHAISIVAQKATLTPTIKRETIYTKECHICAILWRMGGGGPLGSEEPHNIYFYANPNNFRTCTWHCVYFILASGE